MVSFTASIRDAPGAYFLLLCFVLQSGYKLTGPERNKNIIKVHRSFRKPFHLFVSPISCYYKITIHINQDHCTIYLSSKYTIV